MKTKLSLVEKVISICITVALAIIVILSFTKGVTVTHHPSQSGWSNTVKKVTTYQDYYAPYLIIILSSIQILLIWLVRKRFVCIIGILLNIIALAAPITYMLFSTKWARFLNASTYDYSYKYNEYIFGVPVYIIFGLGFVVTVLYVVLLVFRCKRIAREKKAVINDTSEQLSQT